MSRSMFLILHLGWRGRNIGLIWVADKILKTGSSNN